MRLHGIIIKYLNSFYNVVLIFNPQTFVPVIIIRYLKIWKKII